MAIEICMPELSASVTEADLIAWLVKPGDTVQAGDVIAELETDKATVELEAEAAGIVLELKVSEGTTGIQVGSVLALLDVEDAIDASAKPAAPPSAAAVEPTAVPRSLTPVEPIEEGVAPTRDADDATALARRVADLSGVPLSEVAGSGANGRILKEDVLRALSDGAPGRVGPREAPTAHGGPIPLEATAEGSPLAEIPHRRVPHSRMRRTIARRLSEAKLTIPHFYLRANCSLDSLLQIRRELKQAEPELSLSVNDFVIRATALALREIPSANVAWSADSLWFFERADLSVAVATEEGLVTPVITDADRKSLRVISAEMRDLAERARARRLRPDEISGGCFSISNLGMYGVESVTPILNPPQAGILGVGAGREQPVVRDGALAVGTEMMLTLAADHRALDGAVGAQLLAAIRRRLEDPLEMLL